nr:N-acetylmuramoyl-L-alanine amidase [Helicobacter trogontum]
MVLHRTQSSTAASTLEAWKESPYGTHFLIDTDGTIYQCVSLHKYTQHYDKKQDACFDDYGVKFCELKTAKEMQDYMLKFIEIPVKLDHSNCMFMEKIYVALGEKLKRLDIFGILKSGVVVWNLLEKLTKRYSLLTRILLEHIGKAR